jgi:hypothetical protein
VSSIASLHVLKAGDLPAVVSAAGSGRAGEAVRRLGRRYGEEYGWSGYVMLNVVDSLDALDMSLESPALRAASDAINQDHDHTTLISSDARAFLDRLDPVAYEPGELLDGPVELGLDDEEAHDAMGQTLSLLRDAIAGLSDDEVLVLHVG